MQWIYGLFLDLMSYCANVLLGIMSTDLSFFEDSVPIVVDLYAIFVAVGWGLLIGNCAFQCMKAMFAGFGFETESPAILLLRTFLFGFLLIFSGDICEIGLSIGKRVIDLLGIPGNITLTMPTDSMFTGLGASWLLVIIIGFILGFQLIKLFFEIAERYVVVAVLTLLMPIGLSMGGSKSTKDICVSYMRTYVSMIVMMVMNVLFLKLILSALATMPSGAMVLPWCLLVVGIAKTARKADQLISKIGLSPAVTGDPLGAGRGLMTAAMLTRTVMAVAGKGGGGKMGGGSAKGSSSQTNSSSHHSSNRGGNVHNSTGGTNVGGNNVGGTNVGGNSMAAGAVYGATTDNNTTTQRTNQSSNMGGSNTNANTHSASNVRFGANSYGSATNSVTTGNGRNGFHSSGKAQVNNNRFGSQHGTGNNNGGGNNAVQNKPATTTPQGKTAAPNGQANVGGNNGATAKTSTKTVKSGAPATAATKGVNKGAAIRQAQKNNARQATNNAMKTRFGGAQPTGTVRQNASPVGKPKTAMPNVGGVRTTPGSTKVSAKPDNIEATDTAKEVLQDIAETITSPKDGENCGS